MKVIPETNVPPYSLEKPGCQRVKDDRTNSGIVTFHEIWLLDFHENSHSEFKVGSVAS